jgi:hypothetical protein
VFEHDNSTHIWRGQAIQNFRTASDNDNVARQNAANAAAARAKVDEFKEAMHHNYQAALEAQAALQKAQRIAELEDKLAVKKAHAAGLGEAQVIAHRDQHPDRRLAGSIRGMSWRKVVSNAASYTSCIRRLMSLSLNADRYQHAAGPG